MPFERYCDDAIIHCTTKKQAEFIKNAVARRMKECRLELNQEKTHVVYCKNHIHREGQKSVSFDFLGYTFRPLRRPTKNGWKLTYFPCMSMAAKNDVREKLKKIINRSFKGTVQMLAKILNPKLRGWYQYYCKYSQWTTRGLWYWLNQKIVKWIMDSRKMSVGKARRWLVKVYESCPNFFEHWLTTRPYK